MKRKVTVLKGTGAERKIQRNNIMLPHLLHLNSVVQDFVTLIKDYLYLAEEQEFIKNKLFFNHVLYPYVLCFYDDTNSTATVKTAVEELQCIFPEISDIASKDGYAKVGEYLIDTVKSLFPVKKTETSSSALNEAKYRLYLYSPYCPSDVNLSALMDDNEAIYENIGKGYEDFIIKMVKFTAETGDGYSLISSIDKFHEIARNISLDSVIPRAKHTTIKEVKTQLQELEKNFILLNSSDYVYKVRIYLNCINNFY